MLDKRTDKLFRPIFLEWAEARGYEPESNLYEAFREMIVNMADYYGIKDQVYIGFSKAKNCVCIGKRADKLIPINDTGLKVIPPTFESPNQGLLYSTYLKWCEDRHYYPSHKLWRAFIDMVFDATIRFGYKEINLSYHPEDKGLYMSGDGGNTWVLLKDGKPIEVDPEKNNYNSAY